MAQNKKTTQKTKTNPVKTKKSNKSLWLVLVLLLLIAVGAYYYFFKMPHFKYIRNGKAKISMHIKLGSQQAQELITSKGGSVELSGESEAQYKLVVPKRAIDSSEDITLTDVTSITGFPDNWKFVAGVKAEPSGYNFTKEANLNISLPAGTDTSKIMAYTYEEGGKDFHFVPFKWLNDSTVSIPVGGFSGMGIITVNAIGSDLGDAKAVPIESIAKQSIADILRGKREPSDSDYRKIARILAEWYSTSIEPGLKRAQKDDKIVDSEIRELDHWIGIVQSMPTDENKAFKAKIEEGLNLAAGAVKNAANKSDDRCVNKKDPGEVGNMLHWLALTEANALDGRSGLSAQKIEDQLQHCAKFRLKITSSFAEKNRSIYTAKVKAKAEFAINANEGLELTGSGVVAESDHEMTGQKCHTEPSTVEYPIEVLATKLDTSKKKKKAEAVNLLIKLVDVDNKLICRSTSVDVSSTTSSDWIVDFWITHKDEERGHDDEGLLFLLKDWTLVKSQGVFARKTYNRTKSHPQISGVSYTETTTFELIHTPSAR